MKKLLILPLTATLLSACTSDTPAPVVNLEIPHTAQNTQGLSTEEMTNRWNDETKVENNEIQHQDITETNEKAKTESVEQMQAIHPADTARYDFDEKFVIARDPVTGKPIYSKMIKGGYKGRHYRVQTGDSMFFVAYISGKSIEQIAQLNQLTAPYDLRVGQILILVAGDETKESKSNNGEFLKIPRNTQTNKPEYNKIEKGFYRGKTYTVHQGDTLYLVSYISGQSVEDLANLNQLTAPYDLHTGQVLRLTADAPMRVHTSIQMKKTTNTGKAKPQAEVIQSAKSEVTPPRQVAVVKKADIPKVETAKFSQNLQWQWPTQGKVIDSFSSVDGGNKGIDIAGSLGQAVRAAASGQVVYAGNALQGYGNLIIIKHNNDYLSAYAHNQKILVKDKQWVKVGQEIATMGSSGTDKVKLHFEVRYKGQSTNPMKFLSKP